MTIQYPTQVNCNTNEYFGWVCVKIIVKELKIIIFCVSIASQISIVEYVKIFESI